MKMNDKLNASEAVFGFCGWITSRKQRICASAKDDTAPWAGLAEEFCKVNKLANPRKNWNKNLIHPK